VRVELLAEAEAEQALSDSALFVWPELRRTGLAFAMVSETTRRQIETYGADSVGVVVATADNTAMMRVVLARSGTLRRPLEPDPDRGQEPRASPNRGAYPPDGPFDLVPSPSSP